MGDAIQQIFPLCLHWPTADPFLFCAHHRDLYPKGNSAFGPDAPLSGRQIGSDFTLKDGWRMYHGDRVPGFPSHPHRGFETITAVQEGFVDHADSMRAAGRYSAGDTQWMTAGSGVQHAEMFPLLNRDSNNTTELFQIWLNLPRKSKMVEPFFKMFWRETTPTVDVPDSHGRVTAVRIIAGQYNGVAALTPPPNSWAADANNHVSVWTIKVAAHGQWQLPAHVPGLSRTLYFYRGESLQLNSQRLSASQGVALASDSVISVKNGAADAYLLLLEGRPIAEPVAQHGPFVMNSQEELHATFNDYRRTQFGGWSWPAQDQVHGGDKIRFARHADGREEFPDSAHS